MPFTRDDTIYAVCGTEGENQKPTKGADTQCVLLASDEEPPYSPHPMALPTFTIFDVETTGLEPKRGHRIIEIAAVHIVGGSIDTQHTFSSLIHPERSIPKETMHIHGITDEELRNAPNIMTVLPDFLSFTKGSTLVAHNAAFDMGFLETEKEFCWGYIDLPECLCTMRLSQNLFPTAFRHNLDSVCERFNIPLPVNRHRALPDVLITANILLKLLNFGKITSLEELRQRARITAPTAA